MPEFLGEIIPAVKVAAIQTIQPIVKGAVNELRFFLKTSVEEFPLLEEDDWWDYARMLSVMLVNDRCNCGLAHCSREHCLSQYSPKEYSLKALQAFIYRAVIGPYGLRAVSVSGGMLFPLLREEHNLLRVKVAFKQCHIDSKLYEGTKCPYCDHSFDPTTTPVFAKEWLVIQGVYVGDLRLWACGTGRRAHYYVQQHCGEIRINNPKTYPAPSFRVQHGSDGHDRCPLDNCPRHAQPHGLNGTTLWQRAVFSGGLDKSPASLPLFIEGVVQGVNETVSQLQGWQRAWVFFLAREDIQTPPEERWKDTIRGGAQLTESELFTLAEELFNGRQLAALSYAKALPQLSRHSAEISQDLHLPHDLHFPRGAQAVKRFEKEELLPHFKSTVFLALQRKGIREEEISKWLRGEQTAKWQEEDDHDKE